MSTPENTSASTPEQDDKAQRHVARMQRKKAVIDEKVAAAQEERGLVLINTGNGKGKSSAAFGVLARAVGHGLNAAVVQFVKSRTGTGEEAFFSQHPAIQWFVMGEGFTWETQDPDRDRRAARAAWEQACACLRDETLGLVILDEFTYALKYGWVDIEEVAEALHNRPRMQHVILTGRAARPELIELADTVTDMTLVKHAFQSGLKAMPGIEW